MIVIDRCHCFEKKFAAIKKVADRTGCKTISALQQHITFGENCQLCHPYVERMLQTGETVFHEIITETDERD